MAVLVLSKSHADHKVTVPLTGRSCSLSSNPASPGARRVGRLRAGESLTAEDVLRSPPPAASATMLSLPPVSPNCILPSPPLLRLPHALCVCESSTSDRVTVATLPRVELNTLGRQLLQCHIHSIAQRHPVRQDPPVPPLCTPLSLPRCATQEHLMHY